MAFGITQYYCCPNRQACSKSRADALFRAADLPVCHECKQPLVEGRKRNLRPLLYFVSALIFGTSGYLAYRHWMPAPVAGIHFATQGPLTPSLDANHLTVKLLRDKNQLDDDISVHLQIHDDSAKAGKDFIAPPSKIHFAPGQTEQSVQIDIAPDRNRHGGRFFLELVNVEGKPRLAVMFPAQTDKLKAADALIHTISVLAMDMAETYIKVEVHSAIVNKISPKRPDPAWIATEQNILKDLRIRLAEIEKRYRDQLVDLTKIDPETINQGFGLWIAELKTRDAEQQAKATEYAWQHYRRFLETSQPDPNWAKEVSQAIPQVWQKPGVLQTRLLPPDSLFPLSSLI